MPREALADIIDAFRSAEPDLRLELLLDYARSLPPLPERFHAARDAGAGRVPECQTPVFLLLEQEEGKARIYAAIPEESPTVRGFVSIMVRAFDDGPLADLAAAPQDLLSQLGLERALSMTRDVGLNAIVWRLRRDAGRLAAAASAAPVSP